MRNSSLISVIEKELDEFRPDPHWDDETIIEYYKKKTREICGRLEEDEKRRKKEILLNNKIFVLKNKKETRNKIKYRPGSSFRVPASSHSSKVSRLSSPKKRIDSSKPQKIEKIEETESVLNMLFPYVNENDFKIIPFKSGADLRDEKRRNNENIPVIRMNQERKIKSNFLKKYKKYDKDLNSYYTPTIRRSSDYLTLDQIRRREFIKSKKLWVSSFDFKRYFNKFSFNNDSCKDKDNKKKEKYVSDKYIEPTRVCCCRVIDKNKWISKKNFVV